MWMGRMYPNFRLVVDFRKEEAGVEWRLNFIYNILFLNESEVNTVK